MNAHLPAGLRAAIAAGRHLHTKDGTSLDPILKALEENNRVALERFKQIEDGREKDAQRMDVIERKANRAGLFGGRDNDVPTSWGEQLANSPELKAFAKETSRPTLMRLQVKTTITGAGNSGGALSPTQRDDAVLIQKRALSVRDLIPTIQASVNVIEYPRQTARPTAAASVAEGALKPESAMAFELVSVPIRTIAHWIPASRQILDDAPQIRDLINGELMFGLKNTEEQQLLYGSGTGQDLNGMALQATPYVAPITVAQSNLIDAVALAILQCGLNEFQADGVVMHPSDWTRMCLLKDAGGLYLIQGVDALRPRVLFGLPVVVTTAIAQGKFLLGQFKVAATIYDRWESRIDVSTQHADFFTRNLVAILCEERIGLAVKRPLALIYGTFPT